MIRGTIRTKTRAATGTAALIVVLALLTLPAEGVAAPGVTAKVSTTAPLPGEAVTFTGVVKSGARKRTVTLRRSFDGRWRTVAKAHTNAAGRYRIQTVPPAGSSRYRVCRAGPGKTRARCSRVRQVLPRTYEWMSFRKNPYLQSYKIVLKDQTVAAGRTYPNSYETRVDQDLWRHPSLLIPLAGMCDRLRLGLGYVGPGERPGGSGSIEVQGVGRTGGTLATSGTLSSARVAWFDDLDVRGLSRIEIQVSFHGSDQERNWPTLALLSPEVRCAGLPED